MSYLITQGRYAGLIAKSNNRSGAAGVAVGIIGNLIKQALAYGRNVFNAGADQAESLLADAQRLIAEAREHL